MLTPHAVLIIRSARSIRKVFGAIQWIADKTAEVQRSLRALDEEDRKTR